MKLIIKCSIIILIITLLICNNCHDYYNYNGEHILKHISYNKNIIIYLILLYSIHYSYNNTLNENFDNTTPTLSPEGNRITKSIYDLLINNTLNLPNNGTSKIGTSSINTNTTPDGNTTTITNFVGSSLTSNNLSIGTSSTYNNTTTTTGSSLTKDILTLPDNGKICFGTTCFGKNELNSFISTNNKYGIRNQNTFLSINSDGNTPGTRTYSREPRNSPGGDETWWFVKN